VQGNQPSGCGTNDHSRGARFLRLRIPSSRQVRGDWHPPDPVTGALCSGELVSFSIILATTLCPFSPNGSCHIHPVARMSHQRLAPSRKILVFLAFEAWKPENYGSKLNSQNVTILLAPCVQYLRKITVFGHRIFQVYAVSRTCLLNPSLLPEFDISPNA
jgi:hypothetical protein